ncbi:MAG TPA: glycosyltransferase family 2 protein [Candidatus Acidoferrales bacterium]|nr:glycosyltransferase family 2 protein [Candidatus Acidoferrales bacterium]
MTPSPGASPEEASPPKRAADKPSYVPQGGTTVGKPRVVVVMPAYNAARTLRNTYQDIPLGKVDRVILVDDGSTDETLAIARELDLAVFVHSRNFGYGANQKTCYAEALKEGADIVVMLHPDYQYDPTLLPELVAPIERGEADIVLGSRFLKGSALEQGMPWWKYASNRALTWVENRVLGLHLAEYHTGYRAYSRRALEEIPFQLDSDKFVFDQEILVQAAHFGFRVKEVPVPTKYFPEASSAGLGASTIYGLSILALLCRYLAHRFLGVKQKQFESLRARYRRLEDSRPD